MTMEKMPNWLNKRATLTPDRTALKMGDQIWTFAELNERCRKTACRLGELGIKKGDHVALLVDNNLDTVEIIHALEYLGVVMVLLNTRLTPYELAWQLQDSQTTYLIYDEAYGETAQILGLQCPNLKSTTTKQLLTLKGIDTPLNYEVELNDVHTIIYTSGTTGYPKGVILTYGNHWWSAISSALNLGLQANDCWLACVPFFHVSGLSILMRSVIYGIPVVVQKSFDPVQVNEEIKANQITLISVVSVMLSQMLNVLGESFYPDTLRCVLLGGGFVPQSLLENCRERNIPVFQTYGLTETASQTATLGPEYLISKLGSAGKPLFPVQLKIIEAGQEQKAGEVGEIVVKGPNVTKGYYGNDQVTQDTIKDGWLYTGDLGYVDQEGFLYVLDRRSDLIISGGENVYPAEVESVILMHPAVEEVGVAGRTSRQWGQVPVAFVKLKDQIKVDKQELFTFCRRRLAKFKVPVDFYFIEELPRNASKKLLRRKLFDLLDNHKQFAK